MIAEMAEKPSKTAKTRANGRIVNGRIVTHYDYERATNAVRAYILRSQGDPEPAHDVPWWRRGCQPHRELPVCPSLPGESSERALMYAALAHAIANQSRARPGATRVALDCLSPTRRWVDDPVVNGKNGEVRYEYPSLRQVGRECGLDHSSVRFRLRAFLRAICRAMDDPANGDRWTWRTWQLAVD